MRPLRHTRSHAPHGGWHKAKVLALVGALVAATGLLGTAPTFAHGVPRMHASTTLGHAMPFSGWAPLRTAPVSAAIASCAGRHACILATMRRKHAPAGAIRFTKGAWAARLAFPFLVDVILGAWPVSVGTTIAIPMPADLSPESVLLGPGQAIRSLPEVHATAKAAAHDLALLHRHYRPGPVPSWNGSALLVAGFRTSAGETLTFDESLETFGTTPLPYALVARYHLAPSGKVLASEGLTVCSTDAHKNPVHLVACNQDE